MQNTVSTGGLMPAGADDPSVRRACDQCRLRKIRCDKDWPCSNCRSSNRSCTSTGAGQRPKEPRQRVLISSQYERKIDQIENRLGSIESLLRSLTTGAQNPELNRQIHTPQSSTYAVPDTSALDEESSDAESAYGGDQGLTAHTTFASEFIERAVRKTSLRDVNPKMETALDNLSQLVGLQKKRSISHGPRFPLAKPLPPGGLQRLPMPPIGTVIALLKANKAGPPNLFSLQCAISAISESEFATMCRVVYFPSDDFSDAVFLNVNVGLVNLFMEQSASSTDSAFKEEYTSYVKLCSSNVDTAIANLPLFMTSKVENVQALLNAGSYAIDLSRPSVAWHLISHAVLLCQTGGWHRAEGLKSDPPEVVQAKKILFWQAYTREKGLTLRLGRASAIQDYDINIPFEIDFSGYRYLEDATIPDFWIKTSSMQASIYEHLYSPKALSKSREELERSARGLVSECQQLETEAVECQNKALDDLRKFNSSDAIDIFIRGDQVQFHTMLTLVYQAIPPPEGSGTRFCGECLDSARKAMMAHRECAEFLQMSNHFKSLYIHWNLMYTPFAPFFVLFCYVIETSSLSDLQILQEFVKSLESAREASEPTEKLYRLCQVMCDIVVLYVEAKSQQQLDQAMVSVGDEFDMYLSQLGFLPGEDHTMIAPQMAARPIQGYDPTSQVMDWFSGSRNMLGLLEEDLSQMDTSANMGP